jgi:hypothetical protein
MKTVQLQRNNYSHWGTRIRADTIKRAFIAKI